MLGTHRCSLQCESFSHGLRSGFSQTDPTTTTRNPTVHGAPTNKQMTQGSLSLEDVWERGVGERLGTGHAGLASLLPLAYPALSP